MDLPAVPAWHQALAYAVTGRRYPELGRQPRPDLAEVAAFLSQHRPADPVGPGGGLHPVPPDLVEGVGPAQFWAAVSELSRRLDGDVRPAIPVVADRPLSADEQRLLRDVPPHHGS